MQSENDNTKIELYDSSEIDAIFKQKKRMLIIWCAALFFVVALISVLALVDNHMITYFYDRRLHTPFTAISCICAIIFASSTLFFFAVPYKAVKSYYKLLLSIKVGDICEQQITFLERIDEHITKDGLEFFAIKVESEPLRRGDITIRQVLVEKDKQLADFAAGQRLSITTHSQILTAYTICES